MKCRIQFLVPGLVTVVMILAGVIRAQAGGTVNFGNNSSNKVVNGQTSAPVAAGDNVKAALYWAPLGSTTFTNIGSAVNVGTPVAGLFVGGTRTAGAGTVAGSSAKFQVRAWGGGYATYEEALLHNGIVIGQSAVITNQTGNPSGTPPAPPESLLAGGLTGFTLNLNILPPTITCATNKPVNCGSAWAFDLPTAVDGCTGSNLTVAVLSTTTNGQCPQSITRTWAATNSCNTNSAFCSQVVTITDTTPPVIACTSNAVFGCDGFGNTNQIAAWLASVSATDVCSGNATVTNNYAGLSDGCGASGSATVTFTATDACGNQSRCTNTVTVADITPPVIACTTNAVFECDGFGNTNQIAGWLASVSATDVCSGNATVTNNYAGLSDGCGASGSATVTFTATDACGNQSRCTNTVTVADITPPVIACPTNAVFECDGFGNTNQIAGWLASISATDVCSVSATVTNNYTGLSDGCGASGSATVTFTATDACGNQSRCTNTVTVADITPPVIACTTNAVFECDGFGNTNQIAGWLASVSATDICSGNATVTNNYTGLSDGCGASGSATVTFTATDACGNQSRCTNTVTVADTTPPVIVCATNAVFGCDGFGNTNQIAAWLASVSATDACSVNATVTNNYTGLSDGCGASGSATVTFTATDACGNQSRCTNTVTVADTTPPILTCTNKTVVCGTAWTFDAPTVSDGCCGTNVTIAILSTVTNGVCPQVIMRTWLATDCCTNSATCTQTVSVVVTGPPIIPVITSVRFDAAGLHVVVQTQPCYTYALECKDSITNPTWSICQTVISNGTNYEFIDPPPLPTARYYRVRVLCP